MRRHLVFPFLFVVLACAGPQLLSAQNISMTSVAAAQDFRSGVQAYNNGLFDKAVLYFEKSLSEDPANSETRNWLARSYYRSGFDENALGIWQNLIDTGKASALIRNEVATIKARRGLGRELSSQTRFVLAHTIHGTANGYTLFSRPTSVTPEPNGNFYVAGFASNQVLELNADGALVRRVRPGLQGFNHPFDVLDPGNGYLYITNYGSDQIIRCTPAGGQVKRFGGTGVGPGQLLGPEYLAADGKGYIYVTDAGNRRVTKYDYNGNYVLSFGQQTAGFGGLGTPAGIVVYGDRVYVADRQNNDIAVFDLSGNYIDTIGQGVFTAPEGLSLYNEKGDLLVTDRNRVVLYNVNTGATAVLADLGGSAGHLLNTAVDANGDLLSADFGSGSVLVLTQYGSMYAGLSVQIPRVYASRFPQVQVEVNVESRLGKPFTGLSASNFSISENGYAVGNPKLVFRGMSANANVSILIDRSTAMAKLRRNVTQGVTEILNALSGKGKARVITADARPVVETGPGASEAEAARAAADNGTYSNRWRFDLGLRLAASELIPKDGKSAVIFITQGDLGPSAFQQYSPSQLLQYLTANGIRLYTVYVDQTAKVSRELRYLTTASGGKSYYLYRPAGIGSIVSDILAARDGTYVLKYTSFSPSNFGNNFIPVQVEVHYFSRSGRGESGYYAPLQF